MKRIYHAIFTALNDEKDTILIEVPDWSILTEGYGFLNAFIMAKDAIGLKGIYYKDEGRDIPEPSDASGIDIQNGVFSGDGYSYIVPIDIDFSEYREGINSIGREMSSKYVPDKSFLVFDTPKDCNDCPLSLDAEDTNGHKYLGNICRKVGKTNPNNTQRPTWCPMKKCLLCKNENENPIPSRNDFNKFKFGFITGYNTCINEIMKG